MTPSPVSKWVRSWKFWKRFEYRPVRHRSVKRAQFKPEMEALECREVPAATIKGTVFEDFNANGKFDTVTTITNDNGGTIGGATEAGVAGVTVTAFDVSGNIVGTTVTVAGSAYTLTTTDAGTGPYRIQFTLPSGFVAGPQGTDSHSTVQFLPAAAATNNVNLGIIQSIDQAPQTVLTGGTGPVLLTSVAASGNAIGANNTNAASVVITDFPYSAGTTSATTTDAPYADNTFTHHVAIPFSAVGSVEGLAFDGSTFTATTNGTIYAAAYNKMFTGFGPSGTGAIYMSNYSATGAVVNTASLFTTLPGGTSTHAANAALDTDAAVYDTVGKLSLGGIDVSADGQTLYVMDMANETLYALGVNPDGTFNAARNYSIRIPGIDNGAGAWTSTVTGASAGNPLGDLRAFAVQVYNGNIYVGVVNSAESTVVAAPSGITAATEGGPGGTTVTITANNTFKAGDTVEVTGQAVTGYNGIFTIQTANATGFTYINTVAGLTAGGAGQAEDLGNASDLHAYVFQATDNGTSLSWTDGAGNSTANPTPVKLGPGGQTWIDLNYNRGAGDGGPASGNPGDWLPWSPVQNSTEKGGFLNGRGSGYRSVLSPTDVEQPGV